jgi:hypothetical protein
MPYIKQEYRKQLDSLKRGPWSAGELNYEITKLFNRYIKAQGGLSYQALNDCVGAAHCAVLELYRRRAAPYEDSKILENGDVYS